MINFEEFVFIVVMYLLIWGWIEFLKSGYNQVNLASYIVASVIWFLIMLIIGIIGLYRMNNK